jgi:hypothetical protein
MSMFEDRQRGMEQKFRIEEELAFKLDARRNRLFGRWAAEALGLSGPAAEEYVTAVIYSDLQAPGDDDILAKVDQDFRAASVAKTQAELRDALDRFAAEARAQLSGS